MESTRLWRCAPAHDSFCTWRRTSLGTGTLTPPCLPTSYFSLSLSLFLSLSLKHTHNHTLFSSLFSLFSSPSSLSSRVYGTGEWNENLATSYGERETETDLQVESWRTPTSYLTSLLSFFLSLSPLGLFVFVFLSLISIALSF